VFDDVDVERAVPIIVRAIVQNAGQTCTAGRRLLVQRAIYDSFVKRVAEAFAKVRVGTPAMDFDCGPLMNPAQQRRVQRYIDQARAAGIAVLAEGSIAADAPRTGYYVKPTLFGPVPRDAAHLGEIAMRGNMVMKGYYKNPTATAEAFKGGWFRSGDIAFQHPDGYLKITDRAKDIIISGGENVSSVEVEGALMHHPAVSLCAVVAKPDDKWGEVPCAFVELKPGSSATEADLIAHCRTRLAGFKTPKHVVFAELPKTSTGKIQKFELRAVAKLMP
jgi:fatty-acyl-CoA synthase